MGKLSKTLTILGGTILVKVKKIFYIKNNI